MKQQINKMLVLKRHTNAFLWKNLNFNHGHGFSLVSVVFIIIVLTLIGTYMLRLGTISNITGQYSMEGVRAYYAARTGLEWGSRTIINNCAGVSCPGGCFAPTTLSLTQGGLNGYSVTVSCTAVTATEGSTYTLYRITSQGLIGTLGSNNYISRTLVQQIIN